MRANILIFYVYLNVYYIYSFCYVIYTPYEQQVKKENKINRIIAKCGGAEIMYIFCAQDEFEVASRTYIIVAMVLQRLSFENDVEEFLEIYCLRFSFIINIIQIRVQLQSIHIIYLHFL